MDSAPLHVPVVAWYRANARDLPWRRPGFSAWGVLVSEFMLQQTPVARVKPRLREWLQRWPAPSSLAAEPPGEAVRAWGNLGYPRRALWLHRAATQIAEHHGDTVPHDLHSLLALTGIGDYTARAVASFAWGERHPVVDTNTRRVLARAVMGVGEAGPPSTRRDLALMSELLPDDDPGAREFNAAAMELGALVCTAHRPRCPQCPIRDRCAWARAGFPEYTGPRKPVQKAYAGSDRHARGVIMAALREADAAIPTADLIALWEDRDQAERALRTLRRDRLVVEEDGTYSLPGSSGSSL